MVWRYLLVLITLFGIPSVRADEGWEDFANNFATDLAPLVALFGERLTKQFLAESTSLLDNLIFALCPLGILTAVVSLIRICGTSSLRAFVGRANEPPGEAENELLSCVSEGTAELFNDGGISRVIGRPRILEVVVWEEQGTYRLDTLRGSLNSHAWTTDDKELQSEKGTVALSELDIPNLSLNKGIKRRGIGWFYAAALVGVLLQGGTVAYAAMTVFSPVLIFGNDNDSSDTYALPLYFFGSTSLSLGMFLCAFLIERSSRESYMHSAIPSKMYWLQPGRQTIGDQDFGAFLAVDEGPEVKYIKSVRGPQIKGKRPLLVFTICVTMLGFVAQFVGLRGLHPSVIIAGVGSTLIMAVVRTLLRTKRIGSDANRFQQEDRETFSHNQQELDCFAFYLEKVKSFQLMSSPVHQSFRSRSGSCSTGNSTLLTRSDGLGSKLIQTRARLAELTSCGRHPSMNWDDLPIRKVAHDLAKTIEATMEVVSRWKELPSSTHSFELIFACHPQDDKSCGSLEAYPILLKRSHDTFQWKVDANELEAILGLWTFSLLKSDPNWVQRGLGRAVGLTKRDASSESADLCFHKWISRQREAIMVSSEMISFPNQTFGYYSDNHPDIKEILVVKTQNSVEVMAAQDIYIQFLMAILADLSSIEGGVDVLSVSQHSFLAQSTGLDELVSCFENGNLGSREDALLCIVPILKHQSLLPELAGDTKTVRERIQKLVSDGHWDRAFAALHWLCERCEGHEFERSVYDLGYLCLQAMLHKDSTVREKGFKTTRVLLQLDIRTSFFRRLRSARRSRWMNSINQQQWWANYSSQLGWVTWAVIDTKGDQYNMKTFLENSGTSRDIAPPVEDVANGSQMTFLAWIIAEIECGPRPESFGFEDDEYMESLLERINRNGQDALCHWALSCWFNIGQQYPEAIAKAFRYAATSGSDFAIETLRRRGADINTMGPGDCTALGEVVELQNIEASRRLLVSGAGANVCSKASELPPLSLAAWQGNEELSRLLLDHGAELEIRDMGGFTPLHMACQGDRLGTAALLLHKGANIDTMAGDENTPLIRAITHGQLNMVRLLLEKGANVEVRDNGGDTPLMLAVRDGYEAILSLLIYHKANIQKQDVYGRTALDRAKELERPAMVALLEDALRSKPCR